MTTLIAAHWRKVDTTPITHHRYLSLHQKHLNDVIGVHHRQVIVICWSHFPSPTIHRLVDLQALHLVLRSREPVHAVVCRIVDDDDLSLPSHSPRILTSVSPVMMYCLYSTTAVIWLLCSSRRTTRDSWMSARRRRFCEPAAAQMSWSPALNKQALSTMMSVLMSVSNSPVIGFHTYL